MKNRKENSPGYKKTKVGWIPEVWETVALVKIIKEKRLGANYANDEKEEGLPLIKMGNIGRGKIRLDKIDRVPSSLIYEKKYLLKKGDILFNTRNTLDLVGKVAIWNDELPLALYNSNLLKLIFKESRIDSPVFANYLLNSQESLRQLRGMAIGTTSVAAIYDRDLIRLKVSLPCLHEQKKIAEILYTWDEAIEQTRKLIEAKKCHKKALMHQFLTGKKRLSEFSEPWKELPLGKLFNERIEFNNRHLPLLAITGSRGVIPASEIERKDSSAADKSRYKRIVPGDIGYNTMRMWQGVSAVSSLEGIVSPAYTVCIPKKGIDAWFMGYLFKFPPVVHLFRRYSQGLVNDTLNLKFPNFAKIRVKIPGLAEQSLIREVLSTIDEQIETFETKLSVLERQKRGLMQKLLTGEVRVKP